MSLFLGSVMSTFLRLFSFAPFITIFSIIFYPLRRRIVHRIAATFATPARLRIRVYAPSRARQLLPLFATLSAASSLSFYGNVTCFLVIARALVPAAIPCMEHVQLLSLSHALDCFASLAMTGGVFVLLVIARALFSFTFHCERAPRAWQSPAWSTYSRCTFLSAEIAASGFALLAMTVLLIFSRVSCRPVPCVVPLCGRAVVLRFRNRANYSPRSSYCANGLSGAVYPLRLSSLLLSW